MLVAILALVVATSGSAYAIQRTQSGDTLIAKRTLSGNRLRLHTVTGTEVTKLTWHQLNLINGWTNYFGSGARPPAWAKDVQGFIHFRGAVKQTFGTDNTFTSLPAKLRPSVTTYIVTNMYTGALGRVYITSSGDMNAQAEDVYTDAQHFTSLDGVTYKP